MKKATVTITRFSMVMDSISMKESKLSVSFYECKKAYFQ